MGRSVFALPAVLAVISKPSSLPRWISIFAECSPERKGYTDHSSMDKNEAINWATLVDFPNPLRRYTLTPPPVFPTLRFTPKPHWPSNRNGHLQEEIMPCSLLLALGLLTAPECYSSLAEHAAVQWNPPYGQLAMFGKLSPKKVPDPQTDACRKAGPAVAEKPKPAELVHEQDLLDDNLIPAVAEKPKPAESMTAERKLESSPKRMPAIAERAPRKPQPLLKEVKAVAPAITQKSVQVQALVAEVAPMDLSPVALNSPNQAEHAPAIAERPEKKANTTQNREEWQQVAQAWPSLPSHVRSEILRLVENAK